MHVMKCHLFVYRKQISASQLYMPEAGSPSLWVGCVEGFIRLEAGNKRTEAIHLTIAVSRPGVYSLAQGLQINACKANSLSEKTCTSIPIMTASKLEFVLIVENLDSL